MAAPVIAIIGAGPTGLGAGYRLKELEYENWTIYESRPHPGGLASSLEDSKGFKWDQGGHVLFPTFDRIRKLLTIFEDDFFYQIKRKAFITLGQDLIPYPIQLHKEFIPKGLLRRHRVGTPSALPHRTATDNFRDWLAHSFDADLCNLFFYPYNEKVWGYPLEKMSTIWVKERISPQTPSDERKDWGPNNTFLYPKRGGMGAVFNTLASLFSDKIEYSSKVIAVDISSKELWLKSGAKKSFDILISTMPLNELIFILKGEVPDNVRSMADKLHWNSCLVSGTGLKKPVRGDVSWVYFPEKEYPFHRITALSNYSKDLVPQKKGIDYSSLMCETTLKRGNVAPGRMSILDGIEKSRLLIEGERLDEPVSFTQFLISYAYPIPTLERDMALSTIHAFLQKHNIYSRGRFGGWKYEVGNMDHSLMQGMEIIDRLLLGKEERVYCAC